LDDVAKKKQDLTSIWPKYNWGSERRVTKSDSKAHRGENNAGEGSPTSDDDALGAASHFGHGPETKHKFLERKNEGQPQTRRKRTQGNQNEC